MASQKISEFNLSTSLSNSDLFTFVINGTNKNIKYSDLKIDLGVTGTLTQTGNPLSAPALEKTGSNYRIRNIESGAGINASVSAQNGVVVKANFTQSNVGTKIIDNLNAAQYKFKTLVGGTNIVLSDSGDEITIGYNPVPDTRPGALLSFVTPTTTVLSPATPALITGTWGIESSNQMTGTTAGRVTYDGAQNATLPISGTVSCEPVSGSHKDINVYFAKNGSTITNSKIVASASAGSPQNISLIWQDSLANNDYYEIWIESVDGTDLQVNSAKLRVN